MNEPQAFQPPVVLDDDNLESIRAAKNPREVDIYDNQLQELARIDNPAAAAENLPSSGHDTQGVWIYYPWRNILLHCVEPEALFKLRTNRNRELITSEQQHQLAQATVSIAGMSVGSGIALALVYSGIADHIKIADFDTLDTSNLNRLRESLLEVGRSKVRLAAERIYELNPFAAVELFEAGLNNDNLDRFFEQPKTAIVIDEIDDFKMKVQLRLQARQRQTPLIMFTSLGDNILVDIERYDQQPDGAIFNGLLGDISEEILAKDQISPDDIKKYSVKLVGQEYIPTAALKSVSEMGRSLVGRPQLYSTIAIDGGLAAYVVRRLITHGDIQSGRYFIKFADFFNLQNNDLQATPERQEILQRIFNHG